MRKKIKFAEHWREAGYAAADIEFCVGALDTRSLIMGRGPFQKDFVAVRYGQVWRSEA